MADGQSIIALLIHPVRLEILKLAVKNEEPISPNRVAGELGECLSNVSYHARVLSDAGALVVVEEQPPQGALRQLYLPDETVAGEDRVREVLGLPPAHGVEDS